MVSRSVRYGSILAAGLLAFTAARAASVLMISVDGLKPEYGLQADTLHLKVPYLRSVIAHGVYAAGVTGVWPTVTYPSHTTLVTGVSPAEHGVFNNLEFDPRRDFAGSWFWYAQQIKVPTLWGVAHRAGLTTASVGWPVSVGSPDVDFLIPEYWRLSHPTDQLNPSDRHLIAALSRPPGMLESLEQALGPYLMGNDTSIEGDEIKTRFAMAILRDHKPRFMTVHLSSLDEAEHGHGPFSPEANLTLEAIDGMLSRLAAAARGADPAAIVAVVSDHGFIAVTHRVNLYIPFIQAGLLDAADSPGQGRPAGSWRAQPWLAGGMAAIMLREPGDAGTLAKVRELLNSLRANPRNGIDQLLEPDALAERGAFPGASFLVVMQPGFYTGNEERGELVTDFAGHGGHGFSPESPAMRAAFFVDGKGLAAHRALGLIDMRQIAPTVADLLGVAMPSAAAAPLHVRQ
jgi:predicted AlkP superfamily pyrophosphatase or phosphodiesterase